MTTVWAALLPLVLAWGGGEFAGDDAAASGADVLALAGATVWDGVADAGLPDAVVVIEAGRIRAVGPRGQVPVPDAAKVIDVSGAYIMPGLVDAHIHFFQSGGLYTRPDIIDLQAVVPYRAELDAIHAGVGDVLHRYVGSGVTAVVDMGGPMWNFEVREKAAADPLAPAVAVAGPLISTVSRPQLDLGDPPIIRAESPEQARELARKQLLHKPDLLKVWFVQTPDRPLAEGTAIVRAVAEEAHAAGLRLAVHATELETARAAVQAGADILVHSVQDVPVDAAFLALLRERKVIYMPNFVVLEGYAEVLGRSVDLLPVETRFGDPEVVASWREMPASGPAWEAGRERAAKFAARLAVSEENLRAVAAAGIPLAMGTDAGNIGTLHGPSVHRELELMAEHGLSALAVLKAATSGSARVFAADPDCGTIAATQRADLLVLDADPLADVKNVRRIRLVVRGGKVLRPDEVVAPSPEWVVQEQLDAYNARDAERFAAFFADDALVARHPSGEEVARGREKIRESYAALFAASPSLHCALINRTVLGRLVIDQELVTGLRNGPALRAVALYEVEAGLIRRVWLMR